MTLMNAIIVIVCTYCFKTIIQNMTSKQFELNDTILGNDQCISAVAYSGSVCREEFLSYYSECLVDDNFQTSDILVATDASASAGQFISNLRVFGSAECADTAVPFLCFYLFGGICDGNGTLYLPTEEECFKITKVCSAEWELAQNFGFKLPNCNTLPTEPISFCSNSTKEDNRRINEISKLYRSIFSSHFFPL